MKIQAKLLEITNKQLRIWAQLAYSDTQIIDVIRTEFKGNIDPFINEKTETVYGLKLFVERKSVNETVSKLKDKLGPIGYKVFRTGFITETRLPLQVVIIKGTGMDLLKDIGEIGTDYDTNSVIKQLEGWNTSTKLEVIGAGENWVVVQLLEKPKDILAFAKEVYTFNPDYVDEGSGSVEVFAKEIEKAQGFILWWDKD